MKIEKQIINNLPEHVAKEKLANQLFTAIGQLLDEIKDEISQFENYSNYQKVPDSKFADLARTFGLNFPRNLGNDNQKSLVRDIIAVYRTKGTERAMKHVFRLIGWDVDIEYIWIDKNDQLLEYIYPSNYLFGNEKTFNDGTYAVLEDHTGEDLGKIRIYGESYGPDADFSSIEVIKTPYIKVNIRVEDYDLFTEDSIGDDGTIYSYTDTEEFEIVQNIVEFFTDRGRPANVAIIDLVTPFSLETEFSYPLFSQGNFADTNGSTTDVDFIYESALTNSAGIFDGTFTFDFPINPYQINEWFGNLSFDSKDFTVTKGTYPEPNAHYVGRHITEEGVTDFIPIIKKSNMKLFVPEDVTVIIYTSKESRNKLMNDGYDSLSSFSFKESVTGPVEEHLYEFELETAVSFNVSDNRTDTSQPLEIFVEISQSGNTVPYDEWWDMFGNDYGSISNHANFYWPNTANVSDTPSVVYDFGSIT